MWGDWLALPAILQVAVDPLADGARQRFLARASHQLIFYLYLALFAFSRTAGGGKFPRWPAAPWGRKWNWVELIITQIQNTASAGFQSDTNLNTIFSLVPGKVVSVALSSSAILAAN
jgi:hypothetical protein